jgi:hypothetical protein
LAYREHDAREPLGEAHGVTRLTALVEAASSRPDHDRDAAEAAGGECSGAMADVRS